MHEHDEVPAPPDRSPDDDASAAPAPAATAADGWETDAPRDPDGPRCPWCSAPLADPAARRCGACGAQLSGEADQPIPGVTAVDRDAARASATPARPPTRRSVFSWLTGDVDLVDVPPPLTGAPADGASGSASGQGGGLDLPPVTASTLGPVSPDALAPPDARLRREMLRVELEALGLAPEEDAAEPVDGPADAADAVAGSPGRPDGPGSGADTLDTPEDAPPSPDTPDPA